MFHSLLHKETIKVGLQALDRDEALKELLELVPEWTVPPCHREDILQRLILREKYGTTAVGEGVALPHTTSLDVAYPILIMGVSRQGLRYPSLDGKPVRLVFVLILPENEESHQEKKRLLHALHDFSGDAFMRQRLINAASEDEAYNVLMGDAMAPSALLRVGA